MLRSAIPVQVFLHIASESQRDKVKEVVVALQKRGYVTRGIKNIAGKADRLSS